MAQNIHVLQAVSQRINFGVHYKKCSYILGFMYPQDVRYASQVLSSESKIRIKKYTPTMTSRVVDTEYGQRVLIVLENPMPIYITKSASPTLDWIPHEVEAETFFSIPLMYNTGCILPFEKLDETNNNIVYMSYFVDPVENTEMFRRGLEMSVSDLW